MLQLDGLMEKEGKCGYGWLQGEEIINPALLPPVQEQSVELVELVTLNLNCKLVT